MNVDVFLPPPFIGPWAVPLSQMMPLAVDEDDDDDDNDDDEQMIAAVNIYGAIAMCQGSSKRFPYNELIHCLQQTF